jgi:hypothetical protein
MLEYGICSAASLTHLVEWIYGCGETFFFFEQKTVGKNPYSAVFSFIIKCQYIQKEREIQRKQKKIKDSS